MTRQDDPQRKSRRDLLLILLILPLGVLCMLMAGQAAISLSPDWALPANMLSHLDPSANFEGERVLIEPVNPGILTQPVWDRIFLTPNAPFPTREVIEVFTPVPIFTEVPEFETPERKSTPTPTATFSGPIIPTMPGSMRANLSITKTDSSNTYTPGTSIGYTIVVTNNGPDNAEGFRIRDTVPSSVTGLTMSCSPGSGATCGVDASSGNTVLFRRSALRVGSQITITVSGLIDSGATGNLSNSARIIIPSDAPFNDPDKSNNSVTDTDTRLAVSDLAITKSDGSDTYSANNSITYTIVVTNSGPSDALGVRVVDNIPPQFASWTWTCTMTNASGCDGVNGSTTNFTDNGLNIQVGGNIEYTVTASLPASATTNTASISNTASVLLPGSPSFIDPNLSDNTYTDTDIPYIDLQITKEDDGGAFAPNGTVEYTVTVTNNSTFDLTGITVSDPMPAQFTAWEWCVSAPCPAPINTDFTDTIDLPAGGSLVYNVTATVSGNPGVGNITNTATVSAPTGIVDVDPTNNSATETTPPYIDLQITKIDATGANTYRTGGSITYKVTVTNNSALNLTGITVTDEMPALISSWSWVCTPDAGPPAASCATGTNTTNINDTTVNLPVGRSVTYTINANVSNTASGDLTNSASVSLPSGLTDLIPGNNTSEYTHSRSVEYVAGAPDGDPIGVSAGNSIDYTLSTPITIDGNTLDYEIVYYELALPNNTIDLDQVIISIGNGTNWYVVYYWGDNVADTNASPPGQTNEPDNFSIPMSQLYGAPYQTGILIDADGGIGSPPPGTYQFIRVTSPTGGADGGLGFDTIQVWP